jgi:hypothetical protein
MQARGGNPWDLRRGLTPRVMPGLDGRRAAPVTCQICNKKRCRTIAFGKETRIDIL